MSNRETIAKITSQYLKKKTKEFDIGCIFTLNLSSLGIFDLGCLHECTGIVILDLSNNNISSVSLLAPLKQLQILNLASNRLSSLGGIDELDALSWLDLSSNFINSIDSLRPLRKLEKFAHLRLSDNTKGLSNPVCQCNFKYKMDIRELLPGLQTLDGQILRGEGSEFSELCEELDVRIEEIKGEAIHRRKVALTKEEYPQIAKDDFNRDFEGRMQLQELRVKELIKDCRIASREAEKIVADTENAMQLSTATEGIMNKSK